MAKQTQSLRVINGGKSCHVLLPSSDRIFRVPRQLGTRT